MIKVRTAQIHGSWWFPCEIAGDVRFLPGSECNFEPKCPVEVLSLPRWNQLLSPTLESSCTQILKVLSAEIESAKISLSQQHSWTQVSHLPGTCLNHETGYYFLLGLASLALPHKKSEQPCFKWRRTIFFSEVSFLCELSFYFLVIVSSNNKINQYNNF